VLALVVFVTVSAVAFADHGTQKWSGQWNFVHLGDDNEPNGVSGLFALRHETDERGAELVIETGGDACSEPTDYFAGAYTVPAEGPYVDTGSFRGCTSGGPSVLVGRYKSDFADGDEGSFRLTLDGARTWNGTYTVDGDAKTYKWRGTFNRHFADGAEEPSDGGPPPPPDEEPAAEPPETEYGSGLLIGSCPESAQENIGHLELRAGPRTPTAGKDSVKVIARAPRGLPPGCSIQIVAWSTYSHTGGRICEQGETICTTTEGPPKVFAGNARKPVYADVKYEAVVVDPARARGQIIIPNTRSKLITIRWRFNPAQACDVPASWNVTLRVPRTEVNAGEGVSMVAKANGCTLNTPYSIRVIENGSKNVILCDQNLFCGDQVRYFKPTTAVYIAVVSKGSRGGPIASSAPVTVTWR
jgi:hypothetical protein